MRSALFVIAFALFVLVMLGITGKWDYEDQRRLECNEYNQAYDPERDACYRENQENK